MQRIVRDICYKHNFYHGNDNKVNANVIQLWWYWNTVMGKLLHSLSYRIIQQLGFDDLKQVRKCTTEESVIRNSTMLPTNWNNSYQSIRNTRWKTSGIKTLRNSRRRYLFKRIKLQKWNCAKFCPKAEFRALQNLVVANFYNSI